MIKNIEIALHSFCFMSIKMSKGNKHYHITQLLRDDALIQIRLTEQL